MEIPEELVELAKKRIEPFSVEGFVTGKGPSDPKLMLVGEAPGETEIASQMPFSGRAGKELINFLTAIGLCREDVYITSAVRSRPYLYKEKTDRKTKKSLLHKYNRTPIQGEIIAHAAVLDYEIKKIDPPLIVTLGNISLKRLLGKNYQISEVHGQRIHSKVKQLKNRNDAIYIDTEKKYTLIPTFHPAAIFYNRNLLSLIEADWQQIAKWLKENKK